MLTSPLTALPSGGGVAQNCGWSSLILWFSALAANRQYSFEWTDIRCIWWAIIQFLRSSFIVILRLVNNSFTMAVGNEEMLLFDESEEPVTAHDTMLVECQDDRDILPSAYSDCRSFNSVLEKYKQFGRRIRGNSYETLKLFVRRASIVHPWYR